MLYMNRGTFVLISTDRICYVQMVVTGKKLGAVFVFLYSNFLVIIFEIFSLPLFPDACMIKTIRMQGFLDLLIC